MQAGGFRLEGRMTTLMCLLMVIQEEYKKSGNP